MCRAPSWEEGPEHREDRKKRGGSLLIDACTPKGVRTYKETSSPGGCGAPVLNLPNVAIRNTVPHGEVAPNQKIISLLLHNCIFATDHWKDVFSNDGDPQVENCWYRGTSTRGPWDIDRVQRKHK